MTPTQLNDLPAGSFCARLPVLFLPPPPIAALYVLPDTVYRRLDLDCWDITRDARTYPGPGPVIAHPPCGHWGHFSHNCTLPGKDCGPIAVDQVRRFGGILEHPRRSHLFTHCNCPNEPGQFDLWGGQVLDVNQYDYGHHAKKPTRLYIVGLARPVLLPPPHFFERLAPRPLTTLSRRQRQQTPLAFALALRWMAWEIHRLNQVKEDTHDRSLAVAKKSCDPF